MGPQDPKSDPGEPVDPVRRNFPSGALRENPERRNYRGTLHVSRGIVIDELRGDDVEALNAPEK
jgi:hypothetical protein